MNPPQFKIGTIDETDYKKSIAKYRARVWIPDKQILTKPLLICASFAKGNRSFVPPQTGDRVLVYLDGNAEEGAILGSVYPNQAEPPATDPNKTRVEWEDGSYGEYDKSEHKLIIEIAEGTDAIELRGDGVVKILAKGDDIQVLIESEGKLTIAAKEELRIASDEGIVLDALGAISQLDVTTPNTRLPYFNNESDNWFDN